jgi:hypothetical protein
MKSISLLKHWNGTTGTVRRLIVPVDERDNYLAASNTTRLTRIAPVFEFRGLNCAAKPEHAFSLVRLRSLMPFTPILARTQYIYAATDKDSATGKYMLLH